MNIFFCCSKTIAEKAFDIAFEVHLFFSSDYLRRSEDRERVSELMRKEGERGWERVDKLKRVGWKAIASVTQRWFYKGRWYK